MAVRGNSYFNNPGFAQAAANLGALFAPPSGSDAAGWAVANAKRAEADRLAQLFTAAGAPGFDQNTFDRQAVAAGVYNPTQSYRALDMGDATTRRGQDVTAATSRANNAADNERAILTNRADNNTRLLGNIYQPLNQGQIAPAIDPTVAAAFGYELPAIPQRSGLAPTLSETEVKGAILQGLPEADQRNVALAGVNVENVVGPNGPEIVSRPDSIGRQPYFNKGAEAKPQNAVAVLPGVNGQPGAQVPAIQGADGRWVHAQTGQPLPDNIRIFDLPKATGSASEVGLAPTVSNQTQANNQEAEVSRALNVLDLYEASVRGNPGSLGLAGLIRGTAQNAAQTAADLASAFGKSAPEIQEYAQEAQAGLRKIAPEFFDPSIPEQEFLQATLAYALARTENPAGEVGRYALDSARERVKGGGLLANQQSALAAISANRKVLNSQLEGLRVLRAPGTGRTDTSFQTPSQAPASSGPAVGTVEDGYRFKGGNPADQNNWERVQ
jgi:hypothetical protein